MQIAINIGDKYFFLLIFVVKFLLRRQISIILNISLDTQLVIDLYVRSFFIKQINKYLCVGCDNNFS